MVAGGARSCCDGSHRSRVDFGDRPRRQSPRSSLPVRVDPCRTTSAASRPRSGCSSGAAPRSGCSPSWRSCGFDGRAQRPAGRMGQRAAPRPRRRSIDVWARWDSDWFLQDRRGRLLLAFQHAGVLPALPAPRRGRSAGCSRGHTVLAGVVVSLAAGAAAFALLYRLTLDRLGEDAARRTVLFLAVAPTSLFFGAVYSESLFLLLAVAAFLAAERGRFWQAGAARRARAADPLGGRRPAAGARRARLAGARPAPRARRRRRRAGALRALSRCCSPSGSAIRSRSSRRRGSCGSAASRPPGPLGGVIAAVQHREVLDLGVAVALIVLGVVAWRRIGAAYGLYTLASVAHPADVRLRTRCRSGRCSGSPSSSSRRSWRLRRSRAAGGPCVVTATILGAGLCRVCGQMGSVVLGRLIGARC